MTSLMFFRLPMPMLLDLVGSLLAENAIGSKEENDDENHEGNPFSKKRVVGRGAGFGDPHDEGAQDGSGYASDSAEDRRDEGLEARQDAHVGLDPGVGEPREEA